MKKLHLWMLRSLPLPFAGAFLVLLFLLLMQFLMRYLPELVGKGLPISVILELILYNLAYMVVLAVPMAVLVSTLLVSGQMAEQRAYMAIKGAGISAPQLIWPLLIVGLLLTGMMAYFNNNVLPEANYRARNLWLDIQKKKPGFALQPSVFYEGLEKYAIRAGRIYSHENRLEEITILDYTDGARMRREIVARRGYLIPLKGGEQLDLILEDGAIHRRVMPIRAEPTDRYERLRFHTYRMRFDLSEFTFKRSALKGSQRTDRTMRTHAMWAVVDSLETRIKHLHRSLFHTLLTLGASPTAVDSTGHFRPRRHAFTPEPASTWLALSGLSPEQQRKLYTLAIRNTRTLRMEIEQTASTTEWLQQRANRYRVEIHKKYSIAVACLLFVLIGAPLGFSIRRGGLGFVGVLSAGIFLFYWITLVQGEKLADRGMLTPWIGMWIANILTGLMGLYLILYLTFDLHVTGWRGLWKRDSAQ